MSDEHAVSCRNPKMTGRRLVDDDDDDDADDGRWLDCV